MRGESPLSALLALNLEPAGLCCLQDFVAAEAGGGLRVGLAEDVFVFANLRQVGLDDVGELVGGGRVLDGVDVGGLHCFSLLLSYRCRVWKVSGYAVAAAPACSGLVLCDEDDGVLSISHLSSSMSSRASSSSISTE